MMSFRNNLWINTFDISRKLFLGWEQQIPEVLFVLRKDNQLLMVVSYVKYNHESGVNSLI